MKILKPTLLIFFTPFIFACGGEKSKSDQDQARKWFKGNLHTHSFWSDGDEFPEVIMDWYQSNGYQFIALSDHNILADGEKWITVRDDSLYQNAFRDYLEEYGEDWVNYQMTPDTIMVKLKTLSEYRPLFEKEGAFLIIQSEEISDRYEDKPIHLNATNIQRLIAPQGGNSVSDVLQNNIDEVNKQRKETGVPMIPHINHPNFGYGVSLDDMLVLKGERFFEVYNGHPMVHNLGDSTHISTEEMWDLINVSYLDNGKPIMYGLATDDSHHYHRKASKWSNAGRGWIMVQADTLTPGSLIAAMEAGRFYASTGVTLKKVELSNSTLSVEVEEEAGINYTLTFIGCKKGESDSEVLKTVKGAAGEYKLTEDILFVRCKIISTKLQDNPIEDMKYEMAWTQPVVGE